MCCATPMAEMRNPPAEADGGGEHGAPWSDPFEPRAEHRGRDAEERDRHLEHVRDHGLIPITRHRCLDADAAWSSGS